MSDTERDNPPADGDLATRTPPTGNEPVENGDAPVLPTPANGERRPVEEPLTPAGEAIAPPPAPAPSDYGHHAFTGEPPKGRRARRRAAGAADGNGGGPADRGATVTPLFGPEPPRRVKIRKLRVLGVLLGLGILAVVSTVFGMLMAITSDLPQLEVQGGANSVLVDRNGQKLGMLTGNEQRYFVQSDQIAPVMKQAIIAIEDRRFYTNAGVDLRGIGRALWQDVRHQEAVQGGSTITMQFVKNSLAAQDDRTLFQKMREAALAYQITRKWSKERILRNYLNTIYFGNGAYGVEAAARVYFSSNHPGCGDDGKPKCAQMLTPAEAAMIAGMVASPSGYDPLQHRGAAAKRRALVLQRMREQGYVTPAQEADARQQSLPTSRDVQPPNEDTEYPYFTSWVKQQVVDKLGGGQTGARRAFEGGLTVQTTLDVRLQEAAENAVSQWLPWQGGPRASLVAIKNDTGEVLAMVGGDDYRARPFNLATQGQRQPGSSFKPFVLGQALSEGVSPDSVWNSQKVDICVARTKKGKCKEYFDVNNYEDNYGGARTLRTATTYSDNSVYAQLGVQTGTKKIAHLARRMGIRTPVSSNFAMTLGGLKQGVTALDMAHAYETIAQHGRLTWSTMSPGGGIDRHRLRKRVPGPAGIRVIGKDDDGKLKPIKLPNGQRALGRPVAWPVLKASVADTMSSMLGDVVANGTGTRAQIAGVPIFGKTGTTEDYGDAWFVGATPDITVAVWVGYPDKLQPMESEFSGAPVAGGTFPAAIWRSFVSQAIQYKGYAADEPEKDRDGDGAPDAPATGAPATPGTSTQQSTTPAPQTTAPSGEGGGTAPTQPAPAQQAPTQPAPAQQAPAQQAPAEPAPPAQQPAPSTGTGTGGAAPPG
jgi:penicillin-binding protein 1A